RQRLEWRRGRGAPGSDGRPARRMEPSPMFVTRLSTPWRVAGGAVAAALALSLLVAFTPQGASVAAAFLAQFRSQQVAAVEITPQTQADIVRTLNSLGNLGKVSAPGATGSSRPEAAIRAAEGQARSATLAEA